MNLRYLWAALAALAVVVCSSSATAQPSELELSPLSRYFYGLLVNSTKPGGSVYSMQLLPGCGSDPSTPACEVKPVCALSSPLCAPPRWSASRGGWVRSETRERAAERLETASRALVRASTYLTRCRDQCGRVVEGCSPVRWPEGPRSLACALYGSSIWESGYREDIMVGAAPLGRGADGEGCVMQIMPQYARLYAGWLSDEDRKQLSDEEVIQQLLGTDQRSLERCYEVGARMLARFRSAARYRCPHTRWVYSMYAMYGTGGSCAPRTKSQPVELTADGRVDLTNRVKGAKPKDWARDRMSSYDKCMALWPDKAPEVPAWAALPGESRDAPAPAEFAAR